MKMVTLPARWVESMNDDQEPNTGKALLPRRTILKVIAGAPLVATFGLLASPLSRFFKPTMKAGDFFQTADLPKAAQAARFEVRDFPEPWTCIPIQLPIKYEVLGPERYELRQELGFIMRRGDGTVVAFSRMCTHCRHRQPINFVADTSEYDHLPQSKTPVLVCPCDCSTYDLNDDGRPLCGPASRPLRRMNVAFDGKYYLVTGLELPAIV